MKKLLISLILVGNLHAFTVVSHTEYPEISSTVTLRFGSYYYEYVPIIQSSTLEIQTDEYFNFRGLGDFSFDGSFSKFENMEGGSFFVVSNLPPMEGEIRLDGVSYRMDAPIIPEKKCLFWLGALTMFRRRLK